MRKKRCFSKKFGEMSKFPVQRGANPHNTVEQRQEQPPEKPAQTRKDPAQQRHGDASQGTAVQQKAQGAAHPVVAPELAPCQNRGKTKQCRRPDQQKRHILQGCGKLSVGQQQAQRPQHIESHPQRDPQQHCIQQQPGLLRDGEKISSSISETAFPEETAVHGGPFRRIAAARCLR